MSVAVAPPDTGGAAPDLDRPVPSGASSAEKWKRRGPLLPALIFLIIVTQLPFATTLVISFMNWNSLFPDRKGFTGFSNYQQAFTDPALRSSILTTIVLTVVVVLVSLGLGLGIALLLDRKFPGRGIVRTLMIAPFLIVPVAAALVWKHALYNPQYGLFKRHVAAGVGVVRRHDPRPRSSGSPPCRSWRSRPHSSGSGRRS